SFSILPSLFISLENFSYTITVELADSITAGPCIVFPYFNFDMSYIFVSNFLLSQTTSFFLIGSTVIAFFSIWVLSFFSVGNLPMLFNLKLTISILLEEFLCP